MRAGDIVRVPFPHVEENRRRYRPALIVSNGLGPGGTLRWAMMITNALRASWPGDLVIEDHATAGLLIPSKVRTAKLATIDTAQASPLGRLPPSLWTKVQAALADAVRMQAHP